MAKYAVGFSSSTSSTHDLLVAPKLAMSLGGPSPTTSEDGVAALFVGGSTSTGTKSLASYQVNMRGTSGFVFAESQPNFVGASDTNGAAVASLTSLGSTSLSRNGAAFPWGFALAGGGDVSAHASQSTATTLTSVAGTTQASTGYGFTPNAVFVEAWESSVRAYSFGFACVDSAGSRSQWCISQNGSSAGASSVAASRSASTAAVVKLNSTASTVADVSVTSFRSDGLELTVAASDTVRNIGFLVQALSCGPARAGKATVTTNGVGAGVTGVTVTGLGANVALAVVASIASSAQTLQVDNRFSVGFATSNGNQISVGGHALNGAGTDADRRGLISSNRAVSFLDTAGTLTQGVFAVTTDGFSISFDNTNANSWDLYWAAISNTPVEMESHIVTSVAASGHLEKEFETARGGVAGNATIETRADDGNLRWYSKTENTTSPDVALYFDISTTPQRLGLAEYQNARHVSIIPPSTNTHPYRIAGSRNSQGIAVSSVGGQTFPVPEDHGADLWVFTTGSSATIAELRVLFR